MAVLGVGAWFLLLRDSGSSDTSGASAAAAQGSTFSDAGIVSPGQYSGFQITNGESHYYGVELNNGDTLRVSISFSHAQGDLDLAVHDPNRNELADSVSISDDEQVTITASQSGTHYVEVYGYAGASNTYDLAIQVN